MFYDNNTNDINTYYNILDNKQTNNRTLEQNNDIETDNIPIAINIMNSCTTIPIVEPFLENNHQNNYYTFYLQIFLQFISVFCCFGIVYLFVILIPNHK